MITLTLNPAFSPRSSVASFVIEAVSVKPFTSIRMCELVAPFLTSLTVPSKTLRADIFICKSPDLISLTPPDEIASDHSSLSGEYGERSVFVNVRPRACRLICPDGFVRFWPERSDGAGGSDGPDWQSRCAASRNRFPRTDRQGRVSQIPAPPPPLRQPAYADPLANCQLPTPITVGEPPDAARPIGIFGAFSRPA